MAAVAGMKPLLLSELIAAAEAALLEHGDIPVWAVVECYDDERCWEVSGSVDYTPLVYRPLDLANRYKAAFVVSG